MFNCMEVRGPDLRLTGLRCNSQAGLLESRHDGATRRSQALRMTYHADLAPRRRSWLIATPLMVVLALAIVWSGFWWYAAGEAETRINAWQTQQASAGRAFTCG